MPAAIEGMSVQQHAPSALYSSGNSCYPF